MAQQAADLDWPTDSARPMIRSAYERARLAVFVSEHNRRLTEEHLDAPLHRTVVLPNPVRVTGALPLPSSDELRLACVARLEVREKGQDMLLRALAAAKWRDRPLTVTFYGDGPQREAMADLAAALGVRGVRFAGFADDIEAVWRDHHGLVLPSRSEGLPLALLEAMACGRPAIVTDVGGCAELVEDGRSGFVAAAPTPAALDAALERAWAARDRWSALAGAAADRVRALAGTDAGRRLAELLLGAT